MASINESGRSRPTGASSGALSEVADGAKTRVKERDRFGGIQKRKGEIEKSAHASRALQKEQSRVARPSAQGLQKSPQSSRGLAAYKGRGGGVGVGNKSTAKVATQQPAAQPATQAPPAKPARQTTPSAPPQAEQPAAQPAAQAPPAKPARQTTPTAPPQAEQTAAQPAAQARPAKPARTAASMRRVAGNPAQQQQRAGSPRTLPRTIMNVPTPAPRAAPRTLAQQTSTPAPASATATSGYDVLTNAATSLPPGAQQSPGAKQSGATASSKPIPALRSPGDEKFLSAGGFNPVATLVRNRPSGAPIPGSGTGDRPLLAARHADARLPAPPRMGIGKRILDAVKNIFTFGAYGRAMASRANSGRVGIMLTEDSMVFASSAHKHLRSNIRELASIQMTAKEQDTFSAADLVIRNSLKNTGENILSDNEYHPEVIAKVASALATIDKIIYDHTGVAYRPPDDDRTRPPDFPEERSAPSSFPQDERVYETLDEARAKGAQTSVGAEVGSAGGRRDASS